VYIPGGVEYKVMIVSTGDMVGFGVTVQIGAPPQPTPPLNPGVAPLGSPLTESVTGCVDPVTSVTVIVLEPDPPWLTAIPPLFDKEKSKPLPLTLSQNCDVSVSPPPAPVTVIVYIPAGVEDEVVMVRGTETVGVTVQVRAPPQP